MVVAFDKLPDVPVSVTVAVPVGAPLLAVRVNVLALVVLAGLNVAVTPLGRPDADKLTLPLNPLCGDTVIVLVPLAPCIKLRLLGDADRVKFPVGFTLRVIVVWCVTLPDVPVTDTVTAPMAAVLLAVNVKTLVPAVLLGLKDAVTPLGRPAADKLTLPVKPFSGVTVIVLAPLVPCAIVTLAGEAESEKFGPKAGQLFTRLAALTLPIPEAKSQPIAVP